LHGQKGGTVSTSLPNPRQEIASRNSHLSQSPHEKRVMNRKRQPEFSVIDLKTTSVSFAPLRHPVVCDA
jgi:hypothetical protein